jgi:ABC-type Fe3+-siderophore transport system permease subunit
LYAPSYYCSFFSNQKSPSQLLVIGTLINATSWSLITVLRTVVDPTSSARMQRWLVGELDYPSWWAIGGASLLLLGGLVGVWRYHLELQLLQTSREDAWRLGVDIQSLQPKILAVVGLLITSALTLDVLFPLLGMVVPLMVQRWTQKSHMVWWLSGMLGAICVVLADCLARFLLFLTHIMVPTGALLVLGASIFYLVHWLRHLRRELDNV